MAEHTTTQATSLRDFVDIVRRRKRILLIMLVLLPLATIIVSERQEALYEASANVLLQRQNLANALTSTPDPLVTDFARIAQTQAKVARSRQIAQAVTERLHLPNRTPGQLLDSTSVTAGSNNDLLTFTVTDPDRTLAVRLANEYAQQYIRFRQRLETRAITTAKAEIDAQIRQLVDQTGKRRGRLYNSLTDKAQQLQTLETLQSGNASVVDAATSASQVQPTTVRNFALAIVLALLIGLALVFLIEALDTRVRSADDVASALGVPLLGRLAGPPKNLRERGDLVMTREPTGHHAEAFRALRTNIELATIDRPARMLLVTSAYEQEGKSTTAANLAVSFALAGRRVILAELDLRRPSLSRLFGVSNTVGLTSIALGAADVDDALVPIELPAVGDPVAALEHQGSLELLPAAGIPPNVGEFVSGQRLGAIMKQLRERADLVIVDTPPTLSVSDALTLSSRVDFIIAIVRMQVARRGSVKEFSRQLASAAAPTLGFVVTGAQAEAGYGYGGYYAYQSRDPDTAPAA